MRKRLTALAAVGLLIAGAWLGNLFRGFGLGGSGSVEGQAEAPPAETQVNLAAEDSSALLTSSATTSPASATSAAGGAATASTATAGDDMLTILVAEDAYQVQSGDDATAAFAATTLDALVEQARARPGDAHGIRVRLRFRRNAQSGAISDLYAALQAAGIPREQVIEATGFVE